MTLIAFAALGLLVKRSFLLVPTGVMALRTLVGGRSADNYHVLVNEDSDSDELAAEEHEEVDVDEHGGQEDARVLHIVREQTAPEDEGHTDEQGTRRS
ncbi:hypothetical protein LPJ56_000106 [Coemansia sp. RSA 2599]|nr:hypothetical protein LPJ75_007178 [Coemansia sp. RSA 2598]KAJ1829794.1 hypothetical protein LPJ56_000106 [Coemansia sp. RSA 2599]